MACSCLANKKQKSNGAFTVRYYDSGTHRNQIAKVEVKEQQPVQKVQQQYTFTTDTKPDEYCLNCIQKHLALSIAMIEQGSAFNKLVAAGELLLASQHYAQHDQKLAVRCYYTGMQVLQYNKNRSLYLQHIRTLLKNAILYRDLPNWWEEVEIPKLSKSTQHWKYEYALLLQLCGAYCLMFTQTGYQNINKAYAVGKLSYVATQYTKLQKPQLAFKLRQIWKKAQQMTIYDNIYSQVRDQLQGVIKSVYISIQ